MTGEHKWRLRTYLECVSGCIAHHVTHTHTCTHAYYTYTRTCTLTCIQFYWQMVYRRFRVCGEGGRPELLTGRDLTVFSVVWNAGYRNRSTQLVRVCLAPALSVHLWWKGFPLGTETSPPFLALNRPNTLYSSLPRSKHRCFS